MRTYLGIIDWGIGGVSIYKLLKARDPEISVLYFSDTGVTPYGKMSRPQLIARLNEVIAYLHSRGVTHLLLGCNAASTVLPLLDTKGLKAEGVIESAVRVAARMKPGRLALIGGRRTVLSGVYREAFAEKNIDVEQRIAQPLSALIESGDVSSSRVKDAARKILSPVKNCTHLLLACTHYPAIAPVLREYVSDKTIVIDPAEELLRSVARWKLPGGTKDIFLTSGNAVQMKTAAFNAFGVKLSNVSTVTL